MNWHFLGYKLFTIFGSLFVMYNFYNETIKIITKRRKDAIEPASFNNKVFSFIRTFIGCFIASAIFGVFVNGLEVESTIIGLTITTIPAFFGLLEYYSKNDKLTLQQRIEERGKIERQQRLGL